MDETRALARFVRDFDYEAVPEGLIAEFKILVLDTMGAAFIGTMQPWARLVLDMVERLGGQPQATVINHSWKTDVSRAALANGTLIAAFECHPLTGTHASGTVFPAVLAVAERDRLDGRAFMTALILGSEVSARLARTAVGLESTRGFHNPGVLGPIASAAAVGRLLDLDEPALVNAMGIAGSHSAGLLEFAWEGADTKRLHEGRASQLGLESALLAQSGFTGPSTVLEGRFGFFNAFSLPGPLDGLTSGLGEEWAVRPPSHKAYPCHANIQGIVQAIQDFKRDHEIEPSKLGRIRVAGTPRMLEERYTVRLPKSIMGAQYSLPFTTAVALTRDLSDPLAYDPPVLVDALVRELAQRIELVALPSDAGARAVPEVTIELAGREYALPTGAVKGSTANPLSWADACEKFGRYAGRVIAPSRLNLIVDAVEKLETLADVSELTEALSDGKAV